MGVGVGEGEGEGEGEGAGEKVDPQLVSRLRQRALPLLLSLHCNCSAALLRSGQPDGARQAASAALQLAPTDPKARRRRAAALAALGQHAAACADLAAAWKRAPKGVDVCRALVAGWLQRSPTLGPYLLKAVPESPSAHAAVCHALVGVGKARSWLLEHEADGGARLLACAEAERLTAAAVDLTEVRDDEGAVAVLRLAAWVVGVVETVAAEDALIDKLGPRFAQLSSDGAAEGVVVAALKLCQALAMRRVANCAWLPESSIMRLYKEGWVPSPAQPAPTLPTLPCATGTHPHGIRTPRPQTRTRVRALDPRIALTWLGSRNGRRTGTIRAAAEGVLVWLSRHPHTNGWMNSLDRTRLEPIVFKCRAWHGACQIGRRGFDDGTGWVFRLHELAQAEAETHLCLGDGENDS